MVHDTIIFNEAKEIIKTRLDQMKKSRGVSYFRKVSSASHVGFGRLTSTGPVDVRDLTFITDPRLRSELGDFWPLRHRWHRYVFLLIISTVSIYRMMLFEPDVTLATALNGTDYSLGKQVLSSLNVSNLHPLSSHCGEGWGFRWCNKQDNSTILHVGNPVFEEGGGSVDVSFELVCEDRRTNATGVRCFRGVHDGWRVGGGGEGGLFVGLIGEAKETTKKKWGRKTRETRRFGGV